MNHELIKSRASKSKTAGLIGTKRATLALVCMAQFLTVLDFQSVSLALPSIGRALGLSSATLQWIISAHA